MVPSFASALVAKIHGGGSRHQNSDSQDTHFIPSIPRNRRAQIEYATVFHASGSCRSRPRLAKGTFVVKASCPARGEELSVERQAVNVFATSPLSKRA